MIGQALLGGMARVHKHVKSNGKRYAVIDGGKVINVVHWDPNEAPNWKPLKGVAVPCDDTSASLGICPSCGEPVQPGQPTCGEPKCIAGEPPQQVVPHVGPVEALPAAPPSQAALSPPLPTMVFPEPLAQPQPMPLPPPPEQAFTISDLLARADAPEPKIVPTLLEIGSLPSLPNPDSEPMKRERAKSRVMGAVRRVGQSVIGDQVRYELALKAMNDNVVAIQLLEEEASICKLSVQELAGQIVENRRVRERRMMQVYAILARASANIDNATGRTIDTLADKAVQEIAALED